MANAQVVGDPDTGDGVIESSLQTFFFGSGHLIAVNGSPVSDHEPDHNNVHTANGSNFFQISGIPLNFLGNADDCGHTRSGSTVNWFNVGS